MADMPPPEDVPRTVQTKPRRRIPYWPFLLLFAGVGLYFGVRYYLVARHFESTDDAFIDGTIAQVAPQVPGRVLKVHVKDNQPVKEGDLLVELDPQPYERILEIKKAGAVVAEAKRRTAQNSSEVTGITTDAGVEQAQASLDAAKRTEDQAKAAVAAAEAEANRTATDLKRYDRLAQSAVSKQLRDQADAAARVAKARLDEARRQTEAANAQVAVAEGRLSSAKSAPQQMAVSESQIGQAAAEILQAEALVKAAELDLSYTKIYAALSGRVTRKSVQVGNFVQVGQALMALVSENLWAVGNFKETQLTDMRVGQPVDIEVDAYPDLKLRGHVDSFQAGSGARFSLLPPENATGNYVKVIQRVPVKILFEQPLPPEYNIGPGMSVVPSIRVRE